MWNKVLCMKIVWLRDDIQLSLQAYARRSYNIKTSDGVFYQNTQAHLKPYTPKKQECTINTNSVTTDGTITPQAASETTDGTISP